VGSDQFLTGGNGEVERLKMGLFLLEELEENKHNKK